MALAAAALLAAALPAPAGAQAPSTSPLLAAPNGYLADAGDPTWKPVSALPASGAAWQTWLPPTYGAPGPGAKKGDDWVAFTLEGARPAPVTAADVRATYREVLPGVDASYLSGPAGLSELLVLNIPERAPARYAFRVRTSQGLRARKAADGSIRFENAAGAERFSFAAPFMFDASGTEEGISTKIDQRLERVSGGYRVTLVPDEAWLRSPARRGPVVLDPTVNLDPSKDTCQSPLNTSPTDPRYSAILYSYLFTPSCRPAQEAGPTCEPLRFYFLFPNTGCNPRYVQNVYLPSLITYLTSPLVLGPPPPQPPPPPPPGRYRVSACSHNASKVNRSFVPTAGGSYHVLDECASPRPALVHHTTGEMSPPHSTNLWALNAPAGTTLRSADYRVSGERDQGSGIAIYLNTDKAVLEGCSEYQAPPCTFVYHYSTARTGVPLGGAAFLRLTTHCGYDAGCGGADTTHFLYGATVELDDLEAPTVTPTGGTLFTRNRQSGTSDVVFDARDNVGIKAARLLIDGQEKARADYTCDYAKTVPCANQANRRLSYDAGLLRDGYHLVRLIATDASGREATWTKSINVDDTKPTLAAAGTLKDPAGRWVRGGDLRVEARDEASPLEDVTGIKAIDVYVDGQRAGGRTQPGCASGSCPLTYDFTLPATGYADGARAVRVTATDFVGNVAEDRFTVRLDRSAPANALSGELTTYAGQWVPKAKDPAALRVAGTDGSVAQPNSGVATIEVLVDGQRKSIKPEDVTCQGDSCALTEDFAFRQDEYAEGTRRVSAVVTDKAGNSSSRELEVKVDRSPPALALSGPLKDADGKVVNGSSYALRAEATDGEAASPRSGVKSIEILVDGVRKDYASQPCASGSCPLGRSWTWDTTGYEEGAHTIAVRAEDQVGRVEEKTLRVTIDRLGPELKLSGNLWDDYNPDGRYVREALYDPSYELEIRAEDTFAGVAGVNGVEVFIDRPGQPPTTNPASVAAPQPCAVGQCPLGTHRYTFSTDRSENGNTRLDGEYSVRVVATDTLGHESEKSWPIFVDRKGDIYSSVHYGDAAGSPSEVVAHEWGRLNTQTGRRETSDATYTRTLVACEGEGEGGEGAKCGETRERTRQGEASPDFPDGYKVVRGHSEDDPGLRRVAEILQPATFDEAPSARGSLYELLASWQIPPPDHGSDYEVIDHQDTTDDGEATTVRFWVDAKTRMPVKYQTMDGESEPVYVDYARGRSETREVASDFFSVGRPDTVGMETTETHYGESRRPTFLDLQSQTETPIFWVTPAAVIPGVGVFCLTSTDVVQWRVAPFGSAEITDPDPDAPRGVDVGDEFGMADARYADISDPLACRPGLKSQDTPSLEVISMSAASKSGEAWKAVYQNEAALVDLDPADPEITRAGVTRLGLTQPDEAYVLVRDSDTTSALLDYGRTIVIINGPFDRNSVKAVVEKVVPE